MSVIASAQTQASCESGPTKLNKLKHSPRNAEPLKMATQAQSTLNSKSEIVNSKSQSLLMPTQPQNLSRETILPAYKAAISPGPPILPLTLARRPFGGIYHLPFTTHHLPLTTNYEPPTTNHELIYAKQTQSCPPFTRRLSGGPADSKLFISQGIMQTKEAFRLCQNKPNLSCRSLWRSRNKPNL
jgi:hypothetical protein